MSSSAPPTGKPVPANCFKPLPWQLAPLRDKSQVLLLGGSAGGGKSRVAAEKVHAYCLTYPKSTWLITRKAAEWTRKSIIPFFWQTVVAGTRGVTYSKSEGSFHYSNGSTIYSGGMADDKQRESIRSIGGAGGLDGAWMEEANAFTRQDFEELKGRLRGTAASWRQLILTTNPGGSKHWINTDLIKGGLAAFYKSTATQNTHNPADYIQTLDSLTGMMRQRLALGLWINAEGAVYNTFDSTPGGVHVCDRNQSDMRRWFLAMDEGYTNPAVILLVGEDGDGRRHIFREFYQRGVLQSSVCATARQWQQEFHAESVIVDDSAAGLIAELQSTGVPARAASKGRVLDGIQLVQNALAVAGDGKARLTVAPSCENIIGEFESYVWRQSSKGVEKDEPTKENDHACFIAGTLILTQRGLVKIESVTTADMVWSPLGWGKVLSSQSMGVKGIANYGAFVSTPDHKILTPRGNIQVDSLQYSDILWTCKQSQKQLSWTACLIAAILNRQTKTMLSISAVLVARSLEARLATYTATHGRSITARFQRAFTSTMLTAIQATIKSKIWSWFQHTNMPSGITGETFPVNTNISKESDPLQFHGINRKRDESNTKELESYLGSTRKALQSNAKLADETTRHSFLIEAGSVISTAKWPHSDVAEVFNLATEHGCYFANGVLVSNCDAIRYLFIAMGEPTGAFDSRAIAQSTIGRQEIKADRLTMAEM